MKWQRVDTIRDQTKTEKMKLTIKTKNIEIEYQDEYSMLEEDTKQRIESLIKTIYVYDAEANPRIIQMAPNGTIQEVYDPRRQK